PGERAELHPAIPGGQRVRRLRRRAPARARPGRPGDRRVAAVRRAGIPADADVDGAADDEARGHPGTVTGTAGGAFSDECQAAVGSHGVLTGATLLGWRWPIHSPRSDPPPYGWPSWFAPSATTSRGRRIR